MEKAAKVDRFFAENKMNDEQIKAFVGEVKISQEKTRPQVNILCAEAIGDGATASTYITSIGEELVEQLENINVEPGKDVNVLSAVARGNGSKSSTFVDVSSRLAKIQQKNQ